MQTEPERIEHLLDHGWCLVSRLHRWLSSWPLDSADEEEVSGLIRDLQVLWTAADDLNLKRLARTSLAIEQFLERFCANKLELTSKVLTDLTTGIAGLQDLLLGFEATREEPTYSNLPSLQNLEQYALNGQSFTDDEPIVDAVMETLETISNDDFENDDTSVHVEIATVDETTANSEAVVIDQVILHAETIATLVIEDEPASVIEPSHGNSSPPMLDVSPLEPVTAELPDPRRDSVDPVIERSMLVMLTDFVEKIEETCHRLHERLCMDEAPYVTTTSRLRHLAEATRELVHRIIQKSNDGDVIGPYESMQQQTLQSILDDATPEPILIAESLEPIELTIDRKRVSIFEEPSQDADLASSVRELSVAEFSDAVNESDGEVAIVELKRILVVEESLFYRHLIAIAVRSAGYECETLESTAREIHLPPHAVRAILVSAGVAAEIAAIIEQFRLQHGTPVIGLMASDCESLPWPTDAQVAKSDPCQLIDVLHGLLNAGPADTQKVA